MMNRFITARLFRRPRLFVGNRRGMAAVEFALLLPIMIPLYLGAIEFAQGFDMSRKVTLIAAAVANITAQNTNLSTTAMSNILNASTSIIAPYSTSGLAVTVSCLSIDSNSVVAVDWSATLNGTARAVGSKITIPSAFLVPNSQLIFSEVSYPYKPSFGYVLTGTLNLSRTTYNSPRIAAPTYNNTACS
jgi:Flp pilus assembly protein TadG